MLSCHFSTRPVNEILVLTVYAQKLPLNANDDVSSSMVYHECEGRIEKSVQRIAVWHHEACRVMTNGDPEGWIFLSYPHTNNGFLFLLTTVFVF